MLIICRLSDLDSVFQYPRYSYSLASISRLINLEAAATRASTTLSSFCVFGVGGVITLLAQTQSID